MHGTQGGPVPVLPARGQVALMRPELLAHWNELGGVAERQTALLAAKEALSPELLREIEDYWKGGAPADQAFDPRRGVALLLHNVKRYEAALYDLAERADEQEKLIKHREATGEEISDIDRGRWFALLKVKQKAGEALGLGRNNSTENWRSDSRENDGAPGEI